MKKSLLWGLTVLSAVSLARAADEEVDAANVFGVVKLDSRSRHTNIAVPFSACAVGDEQAIEVSSLVSTVGLTEDAYIHVLNSDGKAFSSWKFEGGSWTELKGVAESGKVDDPIPTIQRGVAFQLSRSDADLEEAIYLTGQYMPTGKEVSLNVVNGASSANPTYNLISPSVVCATNLSSLSVINGKKGDWIEISDYTSQKQPIPVKYYYDDVGDTESGSHWYQNKRVNGRVSKTFATSVEISAGMGVFYACASEGERKVKWSDD